MTPEEAHARVLHRDGLMLVVDKPAGLPVHRGPKGGENFESAFRHLTFGLPRAPSLAHRLDKDTSGCLILGRHRKALEKLGSLFKRGLIAKTYWAIVLGEPAASEGFIDLPLGRLDANRGWWMKVDPTGAPSQTKWRLLGRGVFAGAPCAFLELTPLTGRTHQLRVHCAASGFPILGDAIYGPRATGASICIAPPSMHLHARSVSIPISANKDPVAVSAPAPEHMRAALALCGYHQTRQEAPPNS